MERKYKEKTMEIIHWTSDQLKEAPLFGHSSPQVSTEKKNIYCINKSILIFVATYKKNIGKSVGGEPTPPRVYRGEKPAQKMEKFSAQPT